MFTLLRTGHNRIYIQDARNAMRLTGCRHGPCNHTIESYSTQQTLCQYTSKKPFCMQIAQGAMPPQGGLHPCVYFGVACPLLQSLLMYLASSTGGSPIQLGLGICAAVAAMLGAQDPDVVL